VTKTSGTKELDKKLTFKRHLLCLKNALGMLLLFSLDPFSDDTE
jgi:hypothetical protein